MKIPTLLAQYLYSHQRLDLPGIGTFSLDKSAITALENSKQRSALLEGVQFESNSMLKDSPGLVEFIAQKTGKMKSLAASDLDSFLQLALQFLNIGRPFTFEGIGILSKGKDGQIELTPVQVSTQKIKASGTVKSEPVPGEKVSRYDESFLATSSTAMDWKRVAVGLFTVCGVGLAIWGGYEIAQRVNSMKKTEPERSTVKILPTSDSLVDQTSDSLSTPVAEPTTENDNYKYVLEVAKSKRAFKRYNQLKNISWKVHLETEDSVQYKLFMLLPAVSDTSRTLDSLTVMTGRKVYIEYPPKQDLRKVNL